MSLRIHRGLRTNIAHHSLSLFNLDGSLYLKLSVFVKSWTALPDAAIFRQFCEFQTSRAKKFGEVAVAKMLANFLLSFGDWRILCEIELDDPLLCIIEQDRYSYNYNCNCICLDLEPPAVHTKRFIASPWSPPWYHTVYILN